MFGIIVPYAVLQDLGIAITQFVVFVDQIFLVFLPAFGSIFFRLEEGGELAGLVGFGKSALGEESALYARVLQVFVAIDDDVSHLLFLFFVDDDVEDHLVFLSHVGPLLNVDDGILESFVVEIFLCQQLGAVEHVGSELAAVEQSELVFQVGLFALLHPHIVDFRHAWPHFERDVQPHFVAHDTVGGYFHAGEESVSPVSLHSIGDFCAWERNLLSHAESGNACKGIVLIPLDPTDVEPADNDSSRSSGIGDVWVDQGVLGLHGQ